MNSKFGIFSVLIFGVMMLLIPAAAASLVNAQEYDQYYENELYKKKDDKKSSDESVIIMKNEPIQKKEKKEKKEPSRLLVKKELLFCDEIANGTDNSCGGDGFLGPNSYRYVQECNATTGIEGDTCENIDHSLFEIIVTDNIEFPGSEEGTKLNFNGERYTVRENEEFDFGFPSEVLPSACKASVFDDGIVISVESGIIAGSCISFEGECNGIV